MYAFPPDVSQTGAWVWLSIVVSALFMVLCTGGSRLQSSAASSGAPHVHQRDEPTRRQSVHVPHHLLLFLGLHGHMRRIADATAYEFLKPVQHWNVFIGWAALGSGLLQLLSINFLYSLFKGVLAPANPWAAGSLSWIDSSAPPEHNYETVPRVRCGPHEYGVPGFNNSGVTSCCAWAACLPCRVRHRQA